MTIYKIPLRFNFLSGIFLIPFIHILLIPKGGVRLKPVAILPSAKSFKMFRNYFLKHFYTYSLFLFLSFLFGYQYKRIKKQVLKCSLKRQNRTKTIVAIRNTIRVIESEHTGIRAIIGTASTNEERTARIHKVRVV